MTTPPKPSEIRCIGAEVRARKGAAGMILEGYAAKFGVLSHDLGGFREIIRPGAFARSIKDGADVRMLINHNAAAVLARTVSGTLRLSEDAVGLKFEADMPDTVAARDLVVLVERRDISDMSFGFFTVRDDWRMEARNMIRELIDVDLFDVSPVTFPAYPETDIAKRAMERWQRAQPMKLTVAAARVRLARASLV